MEQGAVATFGQENFGSAPLGNRSRSRRLAQLADLILAHPQGTLPDKLPRRKDRKAFYRLMASPRTTHPAVSAPHQALTRRRMAENGGTVLLLHDATELNFSGLLCAAELGHLAGGKARGFLCHNSLAVAAADRRVFGLLNQVLHCRPDVPKKESRQDKRARTDRESRLWQHACEDIGPAPPGQFHVDVCDRGADIFEFLEFEHSHDRHYVVRATHDRAVALVEAGLREELGPEPPGQLFGLARALPEWTRKTVEVPARGNQPARTALVRLSAAALRLHAPKNARGDHGQEPLLVWVVYVGEINPPAGREAVEWVLLTNVAVNSVADLLERVSWYETRWVVEELHKCQKTGCGIEDLQLGKLNHDERGKPPRSKRLEPAIAVLSVVAVQLLILRDCGRDAEKASQPAQEWFSQEEEQVLAGWQYGDSGRRLSMGEFCRALAELGGYSGGKGDGPPGWLTLWRGWQKLQLMVQGVRAARAGSAPDASASMDDLDSS